MLKPRRIGTKLGLVFAGLFTLTMLLISAALYAVLTERAKATVGDEMTASGAVFSKLFLDKAADKQADAVLLSKDFGLRAALTSMDSPTIVSALENLAGRLAVDSIAFIDIEGDILGQTGQPIPLDSFIASAQTTDEDPVLDRTHGVLVKDGKAYIQGFAPVRAPHLIGWVVFGDSVTAGKLAALNALTPLDFDARLVPADEVAIGDGETRNEGSRIVYAQHVPTLFTGDETMLVLTYPMADALRPYRSLAAILLGLMITGGVAVSMVSWLLARRLAKPISDLSAAASQLQSGAQAQVPVRSQDELGDLARAFNDMSGEIARRELDLRRQARADIDTGLPNRFAFEEAIAAQEKAGQTAQVLAISVERFNEIRTVIGFEMSANLIENVGTYLASVPGVDAVARLSGGVLAALVDCRDKDACSDVTDNIRKARTFTIKGTAIDVLFKIGISEAPLAERNRLGDAMIALETARATNSDICVFDLASAQATTDNLSLMGDLMTALEREDVRLAFQPKYDLRTQEPVGVEALVRWNDPARGLIMPDHFIPLAEETGHIDALSRYALIHALKAQHTLWDQGHALAMSVNISGRLIGNTDFCDFALNVIKDAAGPVCFEITETAVIADPTKGIAAITSFAEAGIEISIDDYGSGLSSLAYLKQIPASELKIDKAFVLKIDESQRDALLVRSTIDLAHSLGMKVTAEGIESTGAAALLAGMGCDVGQGYGLGKPMPLEALFSHLNAEETLPQKGHGAAQRG
ncbi:MAG: EAL domain-containing protein [Pseudomonadota bacterium]